MDIICLQEHWLWSYQREQVLQKLLPTWCCCSRASDEYDNITPGYNRRGHGGVAIAWKQEINPHIHQIQEGNERILPIIINLDSTFPICLICCYLPSGNQGQMLERYQEDIAILGELINKYDNYNIILAGDLNVDILHRNGKKEKFLLECMKEQQLRNLNAELVGEITYRNPGLSHESHLDYFLVRGTGNWMKTSIICKESENGCLNNSTHNPITTHIWLDVSVKKERGGHHEDTPAKVRWDKVNIEMYQDTLTEELLKTDFTLLQSEDALEIYTAALHTATTAASKVRPPRKKKKGRQKTWSNSIKEASQKAKMAFWTWKQEGRPPAPHPLAVRKDKLRKDLRSTQRREEAMRRTNYMNDIMEASTRDSRTFHRLIRNNRNDSSTDLVLKKDGILISDGEDQLKLWAEYFENLSTPKDYPEQEEDSVVLEVIRRHNKTHPGDPAVFTVWDVEKAIKKLNKNKAADKDATTAEHLKYATAEALAPLTDLINKIFKEGTCPQKCKSVFKIAIPKKGKDRQIMSNYRGITITARPEKVMEYLLQSVTDRFLKTASSDL